MVMDERLGWLGVLTVMNQQLPDMILPVLNVQTVAKQLVDNIQLIGNQLPSGIPGQLMISGLMLTWIAGLPCFYVFNLGKLERFQQLCL